MLSLILVICLMAFLALAPSIWPGLKYLQRTNSPGRWNIAAYHDPRSMTWSWLLSFRLFRADERRVWPLMYVLRRGQEKFVLRIPFVGFLALATQAKMMRKDHADVIGRRHYAA